MTGYAVIALLAGMAAGWALRRMLLKVLRASHPDDFARIGRPTDKQLLSHRPRDREMHLSAWRYTWGGEFRRSGDRRVRALGWSILAADAVMVAGTIGLFAAAAARP